MHFFSIHGEKGSALKRQVEEHLEDFWKPVIELIKAGYLTYTEALDIDEDSLYRLWYAISKIDNNFSDKRQVY